MVYFYVHISYNDVIHLQKNLREDSYCLVQFEKGSNIYYGVVIESAYHSLLHTLSAETLEQLEYLSPGEFKQAYQENKALCHTGNPSLCESILK